jgi:hypothetical protein
MIDQKVADIEEGCGITKDLKTLEDI